MLDNYKVVVLGNESDWLNYCLKDFDKYENVKTFNNRFPCDGKILSLLLKVHYSEKIRKYVNLPFKGIWFKLFSNNISDDPNKNLVIVVYDRNRLGNNADFLRCLRTRYKRISLVYMFTNVVRISGAMENGFVEKLSDFYDIVYAFDPKDSTKYGFQYSPLLYSYCDNIKITNNKHDIFYVGRAKDRLTSLLKVFQRFNQLNQKTVFYIFGVESNKQFYKDKIIYNKMLSYRQCLEYIKNSSCLLDIIQGDSYGYTIKTCEAIYYDKLLITTNQEIKKAPFYKKDYILVINDENDIKEDFLKKDTTVLYSEEDKAYFSIESFLNRLEYDLKQVSNGKYFRQNYHNGGLA